MATNNSNFKKADEFAVQYDDAVQQYGWHAPEVVFGLIYDRLEPGQCLLDLGIGTGLSSAPFNKAGLRIHGIDGSQKMLDRAIARGVAVELKQHDIRSTPLPYADHHFDHIVACGVFHLVGHLDAIFADAARLVRGGGTFVFTTEELKPERLKDAGVDSGRLEMKNKKTGVVSYLHSDDMVENLLLRNGYATTKTLDFVAYRKTAWAGERTFRAYVAVKKEEF